MKINVVVTAEGLKPATDMDWEAKKKLKRGKVYECVVKEHRNFMFHRKYFALINCAWEYLDESQRQFFHDEVERFRETVQVAAGHYESYYSLARQEWQQRPKSIAFDKMTESDFEMLYERVRDVIYQVFIPNVSKDAFEEELKNF